MDGLALLKRARDAGLRVEAAGDKLLIRGPKHAEPIVKLLAEHKAEVVAALTPETNQARRWRERFTARIFEWYGGKREWQKAKLSPPTRVESGTTKCDHRIFLRPCAHWHSPVSRTGLEIER